MFSAATVVARIVVYLIVIYKGQKNCSAIVI